MSSRSTIVFSVTHHKRYAEGGRNVANVVHDSLRPKSHAIFEISNVGGGLCIEILSPRLAGTPGYDGSSI